MANTGGIFVTQEREVVRYAMTDYDVRKDYRYVNTNYDTEFDVRDLPESLIGPDRDAVWQNDPHAHRRVIRRAIDQNYFARAPA